MLSNNLNHFDKAFQSQDATELRKSGRFATSNVVSNYGDVLDLSACGALVCKRRFTRMPSKSVIFAFEIKFEEFHAVVNAKLVRNLKKPGVGTVFGVEFINITAEQRHTIGDIVRSSRSWRLLDTTDTSAA